LAAKIAKRASGMSGQMGVFANGVELDAVISAGVHH
jgi:hypothetical protein